MEQIHPEIMARAFEIRDYFAKLALTVPLYRAPKPKLPFPAVNPYAEHLPFNNNSSSSGGSSGASDFMFDLPKSAIGLAAPAIFLPPHLLQQPTDIRFSHWGKRVYRDRFKKPVAKKKEDEGEGGGRGSMKGNRVEKDPAANMRRARRV